MVGVPGKNKKKSRRKKVVKARKSPINYARNRGRLHLRMKYKANRLLGMNCYQSAREAGYSESYSRHHGYKIERAEKSGIIEALEDAGATNKLMAQELITIAKTATKRQRCTVEVRHTETDELEIDDSAAELVPDLHLRKETWELIAKLKKQLTSSPLIPETGFKRLVIVVEKDADETISTDADRRKGGVNQAAKLRVETTDE